MSRRTFGPEDLDPPVEGAERAVSELESYVSATGADAPHGLSDRVMKAIEREPAPRRGFLSWLLASPNAAGGGIRRFARAGVLAATLMLAVGGALFAGSIVNLVRDIGNGQTPTPSVSEPALPSPSPTLEVSPSRTPEVSEEATATPGASDEPSGSEDESPEPSEEESEDESKSPRPSATPTVSPSPTPTD